MKASDVKSFRTVISIDLEHGITISRHSLIENERKRMEKGESPLDATNECRAMFCRQLGQACSAA